MDIAGLAFNNMAAGLRRAERVRDTFGKYVPRQVAETLMRQGGRLAVQERVATVLFTDIQGFSTISEQVEPEALIDMLNEYFDAVTGPVEAHGGVISQYQGDAILATFNMPIDDPDHAAHAVEAAMGIQATLQGRRFGDGYEFITRVGINTGPIVGGAVGSKGRLSYTVHGDDVNVAARIEEMNKQFGTRILVAEATVKLCRDRFEFQRLGELPIRGRARGEVLYTVRKP
jgi:class 3 adenylate cyclase